ncbi:MAG: lipid-A-disaccharide synthase [Beijerinckiaceae bacterium]
MSAAGLSGSSGAGGPGIFIVAGESSGDELGASLIAALKARAPDAGFRGVGGPAMQAQGFSSLFPMQDIAVMGFLPVVRHLPHLLARINATAQAILADPPDAVVLIDSPDFTHRVARRVRAANPAIPIVDYVSPTVWAWRPGRAKKMRAYVDLVLALLPFEPQAHADLGGPPCVYTGHPLIEKLHQLRGTGEDNSRLRSETLAVLPGSRRSEITRLMPVFGEAIGLLKAQFPSLRIVLPAVRHLMQDIEALASNWPIAPSIVSGEGNKYRVFRSASAALAASGTVTLELALAQTPAVLAYKVAPAEAFLVRRLVRTPFAGLPNIIAGREVIPEFLQEAATPENLAAALAPLLAGGAQRAAQLAGFAEVDAAMQLPEGQTPSSVAAQAVLTLLQQRGRG